jgi:hypothetical protein
MNIIQITLQNKVNCKVKRKENLMPQNFDLKAIDNYSSQSGDHVAGTASQVT